MVSGAHAASQPSMIIGIPTVIGWPSTPMACSISLASAKASGEISTRRPGGSSGRLLTSTRALAAGFLGFRAASTCARHSAGQSDENVPSSM